MHQTSNNILSLTARCTISSDIYCKVWKQQSDIMQSQQANCRHQTSSRFCPWWVAEYIRPTGAAFVWPIIGTHDVIHKTRSTWRIALPPEKVRSIKPRPQVTRTENFVSVDCGFWERASGQTDIQTRSSQHFAPPYWGKVITVQL